MHIASFRHASSLAAVLKFSADIGNVLEDAADLPALSTLAKLVGLIVGLVFAHRMFGWITGIFPEYASHYDLAFLVVGLIVGGVIGLVLYMNVDEMHRRTRVSVVVHGLSFRRL
ncbi:MAG: hypothetical protein U5J64_00785 [Halobacteriales archaeon]|nr:hypothetical protein [Halobacteriales archaeon]